MPDASKIHPNLAARMQQRTLADFARPIDIIVRFREHPPRRGLGKGISGPRRSYSLLPARAHSATIAGIRRLTDRDDVELVWHDEPVHVLLDVSVPLIGVPAVWQAGATGKGVRVGIVDTGIDPTHPDFAGRIRAIKDFTGEGDTDRHGHGSHVAGIIGGSGTASGGKYRGVASGCQFVIAKALRGDGSGSTSGIMAAIEWLVRQGVRVINLSLGSDGPCDGTDALSVMCDAAVEHGVVVCVAAGNAGEQGAMTVGSPACAKLVITVGATTKGDLVAGFSSRGPTSDQRVKPDICLPGVGIQSCRSAGTGMGTPLNDYYTSASGTSMATPHATGACALLLEAKPDLSPGQVKELLMATAKNLGLDGNTQGKGRADVYMAFQAAKATPPAPAPSPVPQPPANGCESLARGLLLLLALALYVFAIGYTAAITRAHP